MQPRLLWKGLLPFRYKLQEALAELGEVVARLDGRVYHQAAACHQLHLGDSIVAIARHPREKALLIVDPNVNRRKQIESVGSILNEKVHTIVYSLVFEEMLNDVMDQLNIPR